MDDARLSEIEARLARLTYANDALPERYWMPVANGVFKDGLELIAEVRRLRSLLEPFVNVKNWDSGEFTGPGDPVRQAGEHLQVWPWVDDEDDG